MKDDFIQVEDAIDRGMLLSRGPYSGSWPPPEEAFMLQPLDEPGLVRICLREADVYEFSNDWFATMEMVVTPLRLVSHSLLPDDHTMTMVVRGAVYVPAEVVPDGYYQAWVAEHDETEEVDA